MNKNGEEMEEHQLNTYTELKIAELLESKGFGKYQ